MKIYFIICLSTIFFSFTCNKRIDCSQTVHEFNAAFSITPDKNLFTTRDTFWVHIDIPNHLFDNISKEELEFKNASNLEISIECIELSGGTTTQTGASPAASAFKWAVKTGSFDERSATYTADRAFLFKEFTNGYSLDVGLVPIKTGLFAIAVSDASNVYTKGNQCDKARFILIAKNTDQHLYLYQNSRPGYQLTGYEEQHLFCFRVQ